MEAFLDRSAVSNLVNAKQRAESRPCSCLLYAGLKGASWAQRGSSNATNLTHVNFAAVAMSNSLRAPAGSAITVPRRLAWSSTSGSQPWERRL